MHFEIASLSKEQDEIYPAQHFTCGTFCKAYCSSCVCAALVGVSRQVSSLTFSSALFSFVAQETKLGPQPACEAFVARSAQIAESLLTVVASGPGRLKTI